MLTATKLGENVTSSSAARYQWTVYSFRVTKTATWRLVSSSLSAVREVSMSTVMLVFSQNYIKQGVLALNWKYLISCDNAEFLWLNLYRGNLATCKGTEILKYKPRWSKKGERETCERHVLQHLVYIFKKWSAHPTPNQFSGLYNLNNPGYKTLEEIVLLSGTKRSKC